MEHPSRPNGHEMNEASSPADLMSVVELQKFLADELAATDSGTSFTRAFVPLTEGLGLESPKRPSPYETKKQVIPGRSAPPETRRPEPKKELSSTIENEMGEEASAFEGETLAPVPSAGFITPEPSPISHKDLAVLMDGEGEQGLNFLKVSEKSTTGPKQPDSKSENALNELSGRKEMASLRSRPFLDGDDVPPVDPLIAAQVSPKMTEVPVAAPQASAVSVPPPLPAASWFRRAQAALVDHVVALFLWGVALVITSHSLSHANEPFTLGNVANHLIQDFSNNIFLKYAALAFLAVWFCYLMLSLGILGMTLGMWAWGLRVNYGVKKRFLKKSVRLMLSLVFLSPIIPSILLIFRVRGRNLLDYLSGTSLYRSAS